METNDELLLLAVKTLLLIGTPSATTHVQVISVKNRQAMTMFNSFLEVLDEAVAKAKIVEIHAQDATLFLNPQQERLEEISTAISNFAKVLRRSIPVLTDAFQSQSDLWQEIINHAIETELDDIVSFIAIHRLSVEIEGDIAALTLAHLIEKCEGAAQVFIDNPQEYFHRESLVKTGICDDFHPVARDLFDSYRERVGVFIREQEAIETTISNRI